MSGIDRVGPATRDLAAGNYPRNAWLNSWVELPSPRPVAVVSNGEGNALEVHGDVPDSFRLTYTVNEPKKQRIPDPLAIAYCRRTISEPFGSLLNGLGGWQLWVESCHEL